MGIQTTVKATRAASLDDLLALSLKRLDRMLLSGTTTVEAKSGYGLNLEDELKQLECLRDLAALHPVDIVPTFMGANDIPPEYRERRGDYVRLLVDTLIPEVRERGLAEFFDVFCEPSAFSLEETRTLTAAAKAAGFKVEIHADEFVTLGGAAPARRRDRGGLGRTSHYVLEGSVRREGNRVRITAQLINALTGRNVFSERYDRELKEIFATQDDIAIKVLTALRVALTDGEIARLQGRGVSNIEAYFKLLQAHTLTQAMNKESSARARRLGRGSAFD